MPAREIQPQYGTPLSCGTYHRTERVMPGSIRIICSTSRRTLAAVPPCRARRACSTYTALAKD